MPDTLIPPGETKLLVPASDTEEWWSEVYEASVQLGRTAQAAVSRGRSAPPGDRGVLQAEENEEVWAHNPSTDTTATVHLEHNGFLFERQARAVVGSVLTSSENETSPAHADFVHRQDTGLDLSAGDVVETVSAPDRADFVVAHVEGNDSFEAVVNFTDGEGTTVTSRRYQGSASDDVFTRVAIASPDLEVVLTGSATNTAYNIYAR